MTQAEEEVNHILRQQTGTKLVFPDGIDPYLKVAVSATKSFRDTQAIFTKLRQQIRALEDTLNGNL
jgi:hypothetical protein